MNLPEFRKGTWDFDIFRSVTLNQYKIPSKLKNIKVIDIGGHIGAFSWLCAKAGCSEVFYCEADKENFDIGVKFLDKNFGLWKKSKPTFILFNMAIWKDDGLREITFQKCIESSNTGGGSVVTDEDGFKIPVFPFDEMIKLRLNKKHEKEKVLLKLDCEGSEFPILFDSKELNQIDYICGEYHELFETIPKIAKVEGYTSYDVYTLQKFLKTNGFLFTYFNRSKDSNNKNTSLGQFWASRTKQSFFLNIKLSEKYQDNI